MKLIVDNLKTVLSIGGADYLYKTEFIKELRQYMRERPEGYNRVPSFKSKRWDGYRYFINERGVFATGYLPMVLKFLRELANEEKELKPSLPEMLIEVQDMRTNFVEMFSDASFVECVGDKSLREYQERVVKAVRDSTVGFETQIPFQRGIIDSATNSGKTVIMGGLIANMVNPKVLVLVDRGLVFSQLKEYLAQFGEVAIIGEGKCEFSNITLAMAQTLYGRLDSLNTCKQLKTFDAVFMDEGHKAASSTYTDILSKLDASMRLVISGTPLDMKDKVAKMIIVGVSGVRLAKISNQEMIDANVSLKPIIHFHRINDSNVVMSSNSFAAQSRSYHTSIEAVRKVKEILDVVEKDTLITFNYEAHGTFIYNSLQALGVDCTLTHGKDKQRKQKVEDFKQRKSRILIASMILKEGVNIPNIQRIIRLEGGKSDITTKQIVGRGLRVDENSTDTEVEIHDFYVDGKYTQRHSVTRIGTYRAEGFEFIFHYETKNGRPKIKRISKIK